MVYRKGERTNRHCEEAHAFGVDIPVPPSGLGSGLDRIHKDVAARSGEVWSWWGKLNGRDIPTDWVRCGFHKAEDADAFATAWATLWLRKDAR